MPAFVPGIFRFKFERIETESAKELLELEVKIKLQHNVVSGRRHVNAQRVEG